MKTFSIFLATSFFFLLSFASFAYADTTLYIREIEYKENGSVRILFDDNAVHLAKLKWSNKEDINVYDRVGNKVKAQVTWRGKDALELYVPLVRANETYTFEIREISYGREPSVALSGYFCAIPGWKLEYTEPMHVRRQISARNMHSSLYISDAHYRDNGFVQLTFGLREDEPEIKWDGTERVTVEGRYGRYYQVLVSKYEPDGMVVGISGLLRGESYFIEVQGIPYKGERIALGTEFVADETWTYKLGAAE